MRALVLAVLCCGCATSSLVQPDGTKLSATAWWFRSHATAGDCAASFEVNDTSNGTGLFKAAGTAHEMQETLAAPKLGCVTANVDHESVSVGGVQAIGEVFSALGSIIGTAISTVIHSL